MSIVLEKAKELGMLIAESDEIKAFQLAEKIFMSNEEAQKLLSEYEQKRVDITNQMRQPGLTPEKLGELRGEIQESMLSIKENEIVNQYIETKTTFNQLINRINSIISYCIKGDDEGGCSSGSCSSCKGCH